jgi:hypothetical protein
VIDLDAELRMCSVNAASDFIIKNGIEQASKPLDEVTLSLPQLCKQLKKINFSFKYRLEGSEAARQS